MANITLPENSGAYFTDADSLDTTYVRAVCKAGSGDWYGFPIPFDGSEDPFTANTISNVVALDYNPVGNNKVSVIAPASMKTGTTTKDPIIMGAKNWAVHDGASPNIKSTFNRNVCELLGLTSAVSPTDPVLGATLGEQIDDMHLLFSEGCWVTAANAQTGGASRGGLPPLLNHVLSNPGSTNLPPTLKAYWNFQDNKSFRTSDAQSGATGATIFDLTGNGNSLTIGGQALSNSSLYEDAASNLHSGQYGWDLSQGAGAGTNYATCASNIVTTGDVTIFFYLGKRENNSSAVRYAWDARPGGGDYMTTVDGGNMWNWNNNLTGGSTSLYDEYHFVTAVADPGSSLAGTVGMKIDVSYVQTLGGVFYNNIASGGYVAGSEVVGADFCIGGNGNVLGQSKWPGMMSIFGILSCPLDTWEEDLNDSQRDKIIEILHYYHKYMITTYMP